MRTAYAAAANPVYSAWSTSYMHQWLVDHGIIKSDYEKNRDKLIEQLQRYYYGTTDTVYSTWSNNQLRDWLVQHNIIKSDAQIKREKLQKLVRDNYLSAKGTAWDGWTESELRQWLIDNGYMRSDAQAKRDELVDLMNRKYSDAHHKTADYLTWPDARLRAYLRAHGVDESQIPATRPGLLVSINQAQGSSTF
ncbi:Ish1 domain-containing protein [Rhizoctonia solani AG-1 IA]|uniref:Ish1 domain-containing protein n=1 Tax=Thanatephorus cucumeris (strain AG1-IA) TaxID=983506 RepID=L8WN09_THACA|nr:Ish1 domain-containing protein [Rhizoctonia solani AG-1 IA]